MPFFGPVFPAQDAPAVQPDPGFRFYQDPGVRALPGVIDFSAASTAKPKPDFPLWLAGVLALGLVWYWSSSSRKR